MKELIKGKKTYGVAVAMILTAIQPALIGEGLAAIDMQTVWLALLAITGRAAVSKSELK